MTNRNKHEKPDVWRSATRLFSLLRQILSQTIITDKVRKEKGMMKIPLEESIPYRLQILQEEHDRGIFGLPPSGAPLSGAAQRGKELPKRLL